jgi:hypothetical protein
MASGLGAPFTSYRPFDNASVCTTTERCESTSEDEYSGASAAIVDTAGVADRGGLQGWQTLVRKIAQEFGVRKRRVDKIVERLLRLIEQAHILDGDHGLIRAAVRSGRRQTARGCGASH